MKNKRGKIKCEHCYYKNMTMCCLFVDLPELKIGDKAEFTDGYCTVNGEVIKIVPKTCTVVVKIGGII